MTVHIKDVKRKAWFQYTLPEGADVAPYGGTLNTVGGPMFGIPTPNGGGTPGVGGTKPGGGIPYGGNVDTKDPGVGVATVVAGIVPAKGGPVTDFQINTLN